MSEKGRLTEAVSPASSVAAPTLASRVLARRITDIVREEGVTESVAAERVSSVPWEILMKREDFRVALHEVSSRYATTPEERRELVRSSWTKTLIEGMLSNDPIQKKLALDASKMMADDLGILNKGQLVINTGLQVGDGPAVPVHPQELRDILADESKE